MNKANLDSMLCSPVGTIFYHKTLTNRDGSKLRARVNGKLQVRKREKTWRLPMKYGLKECFYITPSTVNEWIG